MEHCTTPQHYAAYGLAISSSIPLTEFISKGTGDGEVVVSYGEVAEWTAAVRGQRTYFAVGREEARFWFQGVGAFLVKDGRQVIAIPEDDLDRSRLRLYIQGMMMATILHQRGKLVLHASVVEVNGSALAFLGSVGSGKSSLAAALYSRGHRLLTDDNAAVELTSGTAMVLPSYPSVKLFPEIASSLRFHNGSLSVLHSTEVKVAGAVTDGFVQKPLPLCGVYFLGRDYDAEIGTVPPLQAAMELIRNSVPTRWGHPGDALQLQQCGWIADQVPAFTLKTFSDLGSLAVLAETVENHHSEVEQNLKLQFR